jgi:hypothetical protein
MYKSVIREYSYNLFKLNIILKMFMYTTDIVQEGCSVAMLGVGIFVPLCMLTVLLGQLWQ